MTPTRRFKLLIFFGAAAHSLALFFCCCCCRQVAVAWESALECVLLNASPIRGFVHRRKRRDEEQKNTTKTKNHGKSDVAEAAIFKWINYCKPSLLRTTETLSLSFPPFFFSFYNVRMQRKKKWRSKNKKCKIKKRRKKNQWKENKHEM